jgi:succinate dehydrogenase/fumarate reductase cytochrome b subunit
MQEDQSIPDLKVDEETTVNLTEVSRWAKFMGVLVLVAIGLVFLMCGFLWNRIPIFFSSARADTELSNQVKISLLIFLILVAGVLGVLMYFLIKGANCIRAGLRNRDQYLFTIGLGYLRNYFIMYGVISIISLLFNLISLR